MEVPPGQIPVHYALIQSLIWLGEKQNWKNVKSAEPVVVVVVGVLGVININAFRLKYSPFEA